MRTQEIMKAWMGKWREEKGGGGEIYQEGFMRSLKSLSVLSRHFEKIIYYLYMSVIYINVREQWGYILIQPWSKIPLTFPTGACWKTPFPKMSSRLSRKAWKKSPIVFSFFSHLPSKNIQLDDFLRRGRKSLMWLTELTQLDSCHRTSEGQKEAGRYEAGR